MTTSRRENFAKVIGMLSAGIGLACATHTESKQPDRARQVAQAESSIVAVTFDTVSWPDDSARTLSGNVVYASRCAECHGYLGGGTTAYADSRGLKAPSLVAANWHFADDLGATRRRIYSGHEKGMPTWGKKPGTKLTPREVDAVAFYVLHQLREDAQR